VDVARKQKIEAEETIIIDEEKNLIFNNEDEVLDYFAKPVQFLEQDFIDNFVDGDFDDDEALKLESNLEAVLHDPDEIWEDNESFKDHTFGVYIKSFSNSKGQHFHYVALTYVAQELPTFIYLHFPTRYAEVLDRYRKGEKTFDRSSNGPSLGGIEGDALSESDPLATGLYQAMLKLRAENDLPETLFPNYSELREESIEEADEIWRSTTLNGYTLVTFIKDFSRYEADGVDALYYLSITVEDGASNSHALLFSFPTNDETLVDRYRHGENLQAEEVVQESSH